MKKQPRGRQTCAHADRYMDVDDSCSWITLLLFVCLIFGGNPQGLQAEQGEVRRWNISSLWRASFINSSQHPSQLLIPAPHGWDLVGSESAFAWSPVCVTKAEKTSSCLLAKESLFCYVSNWTCTQATYIHVYWPAGLPLFLLGAQVLHADFLTTMLSRQWEEPVLV